VPVGMLDAELLLGCMHRLMVALAATRPAIQSCRQAPMHNQLSVQHTDGATDKGLVL